MNPPIPVITPQRWILNKADWKKYEQSVDLSGVENFETADEMVDFVVQQVIIAANNSIPLSKNVQKKHHPVPGWNADCEKAVKNKRKLFRHFKKHPTVENLSALKLARAVARREIFKSKRENWRSFISSINSSTPTSLLWSKIRRISQKPTFGPISALQIADNSLITSVPEITETCADSYFENTKCTSSYPLSSPDQSFASGNEDLNQEIT